MKDEAEFMDFFEMADDDMLLPEDTGGLQLYLDSADPDHWERLLPLGVFRGVTTNPVLLERAGQACTLANLETLVRRAVDLGCGEIHLQTWGRTPEEMIHHGSQLALMAGLGIATLVKIPCTTAGLQVAEKLAASGCRITLTGIFNPAQVVLAAGFDADYAAPYLGRLNDAGRDGPATVRAMHDILRKSGSRTRLLVASLRHADQVWGLAAQGLDTFTLNAAVMAELLTEPLTATAAADFQRAAEAMGGGD
ncbi:transaldolase [bacterium DOLZORAL124_64_63]|nr:MAG: transaldolase [bacterium DOLZORAL124_64_63]